MARVRNAQPQDVATLFGLINGYAREGRMLPRSLQELNRACGQFAVAEQAGRIIGCGALKIYSPALAEVRSLSVEPGELHHGVGRALTEFLLRKAADAGVKTVFALTLSPGFFERCGFHESTPAAFPAKVRRERFLRNRHPHPAKKTMVLTLPAAQPAFAISTTTAPATA